MQLLALLHMLSSLNCKKMESDSSSEQISSYQKYFRAVSTPSRTKRNYRQYNRDHTAVVPRYTLWWHKKEVAAAHKALALAGKSMQQTWYT